LSERLTASYAGEKIICAERGSATGVLNVQLLRRGKVKTRKEKTLTEAEYPLRENYKYI